MNTAPFVRGSATSKAAARSIAIRLPGDRGKILHALEEAHPRGLTCNEFVQRTTGMAYSTASGRFSDLAKEGLIVKTAVERRTTNGEMAAVYQLAGTAVAAPATPRAKQPSKVMLRSAANVLRTHAPGLAEVAAWLEARGAE